jgi:hypothetical protein
LRADFAPTHFGLPPRIVQRVALVLVRVSQQDLPGSAA